MSDHGSKAVTTVSSNGFSHEDQVLDALRYLRDHFPEAYAELLSKIPREVKIGGKQFDREAWDRSGDLEWSSYLCDDIEDTGLIWWEEGEPFGFVPEVATK